MFLYILGNIISVEYYLEYFVLGDFITYPEEERMDEFLFWEGGELFVFANTRNIFTKTF